MKTPDLQRAHTTEERFPFDLPIPEEKYSNINILKNTPASYKGSPFELRTNDGQKSPNEQMFLPLSKDQLDGESEFSEEKSEEIMKKQRQNEIINYISESSYNTIDDKKFKKNKQDPKIEELNQKRKESPENGKERKNHKKRQVKVEIAKKDVNNKNKKYKNKINPNKNVNGKDEYMYYCEVPFNDEEGTLDNVSFSNKNIDTNNLSMHKSKDKINPKILKQFKLISELENNKLIQKLEKEKEKLSKENQKLNKSYLNLENERQKFEKEKKLFFESRQRVIDDTRKNEERLINLENELENKYLGKKKEIQEMRNLLKQEQLNLENERNNMRNNYQIRLSKLEEDYKIKEDTQNYNNNLNIDKARKEQELLRQKELEINKLNKAFMDRENNLNMRENELINKENELQEKEENLNNKYQSLLEKENMLKGEKEKFLNSSQFDKNDLFKKSQQLKNKEEQLVNRENILLDKENELANRENMINSVENELKLRENQLNETQNKLFNQQNEINDKEKKINLLDEEIRDKKNKIMELNNTYNNMMSKMSSPGKQDNNLNESKGSKEIKSEINNFDSLNKPPISSVKKLDSKFSSNENGNMSLENKPINKVVTFGNKPSLQSNLSNNNNDIRDNDSYPENNLNDIKDNDAFPENHLHDIQDNDEYPENHGEDDFVYGNNNINNDNMNKENPNNNNDNNDNNNYDKEYDDIAEDFDQYINNQSNTEKTQNMDEINDNNNNINLPMNVQAPNEKEDENTEPYNLFQENNNDLMQSQNNESKNDIKNSQQNNNNENNDIDRNNDSESGELDLNNLKNNYMDMEEEPNQNQIKQSNQNNKNNTDDHEEEIKNIMEELYIEEYNPSLGLIKLDYPNFLNSLIQCFAHIPDITDKIINLHLELNFQKNLPKLKLTNNYRNVLINLFFPEKVYNMNREAFNATKFRNAVNELNPLFKNNEKIELKEYINYFILKLHDELNVKKDSFSQYHEKSNNEMELKTENEVLVDFLRNFTDKNKSIISKNLYGVAKFTLYCNQCQNTFYNFHCYSHLYFNIENVLDYKINRYHREDIELELKDFLEYYQKPETLRGDDGIFCPSCKTQTESTSIKSIYSTKNVIIFIFDRNIGNNFNQTFINFEENLNLRDNVEYKKDDDKKREKFFLGGVINYYLGDDEQSGTYNAFVRMGKKNDWYCYDNENVYSVTFDDIKNNGYPVVLFYHKLTKK